MLRMEDQLFGHPYYLKGALGAIRTYLALADRPSTAQQVRRPPLPSSPLLAASGFAAVSDAAAAPRGDARGGCARARAARGDAVVRRACSQGRGRSRRLRVLRCAPLFLQEADEEALLASMSPEERKKYKLKRKKVQLRTGRNRVGVFFHPGPKSAPWPQVSSPERALVLSPAHLKRT